MLPYWVSAAIKAIVLTGKTWHPELGVGTCGGARVMQVLSVGDHRLPGELEIRELGKGG